MFHLSLLMMNNKEIVPVLEIDAEFNIGLLSTNLLTSPTSVLMQ